MSDYDDKGRPYWHCICPFCGEREAVLFGDGLSRTCRVCGARWDEFITMGRFIEPRCSRRMQESPIAGVHHIPWHFAQDQNVEEPKAIETTEKEETQMSKELQVFSFEERETRVTMVKGEPWIVAKDVADALGYAENSNPARLFQAVPDEWKGVKRIHTLGGSQKMLCLSEQGLYFFLGRSDKPKALPYQRWIAGEVVPSIRKTGEYATPAAKKRKADKDDELALRRIEVMEKNADYRMAKLILEGIDKFKDVMTPESKTVFMAKYGELTAKHDMTHMLPHATEKWYSAAELGTEFGVSAQRIGKTANENELKAPEGESNQYGTWIRSKSQYSSREVMTWVYYEAAREWFARYFGKQKTA